MYINVRSRLVGMDPAIEEAARDLGAGPWRVLRDITLPLIAPSVASGMLLALAMSLDDVVISFFVTGATTTTLPLKVYTCLLYTSSQARNVQRSKMQARNSARVPVRPSNVTPKKRTS